MPIARNLHFTGRDKTLRELRRQLLLPNPLSRVQILHGPGGIGKTQTAAEFAHRFREAYGIIWWMHADSPAGLETSLAELARTLGLCDSDDLAPVEIRRLLFRHLGSRKHWLLIIDDADNLTTDPAAVAAIVPPQRTGHVIVTSRSPNWLEVGRPFPIGVFDRAESVTLLLHRTDRKESPEIADKLAAALGDLPLALDQAAALIEQTRISFSDYLKRFETHWAELLRSGKPSADYPMSVTMSWEMSFKQVEEQSPHAAEILAICAHLSPEGIPRRLLRQIAQYAPPGVGFILGDPVACNEAVGKLASFSLIDADDIHLHMHPLAAGLARYRLTEDERRTWAGVAVRAMETAFKFDPAFPSDWRESGELLTHALAAAKHADEAGVLPGAVRSIYNAAGRYLLAAARFDQARVLLERALEIAIAVWGADSSRLSPIANNLGRVMLRLGDSAGAKSHFERALQLDEKAFGPAHPHVAEVVNNRGVSLYMLGDAPSAESDFRRALAIYQKNVGQEHGKIAAIVNNLGYSLVSRGELSAARTQFTSALKMAKETLGKTHPTVAAVLRNLGHVCHQLQQGTDAKLCFEQAAEIDERVLGPDHPDAAADLAGIAEAVELLGEFPKAKTLMTRAAEIEEGMPKPDQSHLAERYTVLARIFTKLGDTDESRRFKVKADLAISAAARSGPRREVLATFSLEA